MNQRFRSGLQPKCERVFTTFERCVAGETRLKHAGSHLEELTFDLVGLKIAIFFVGWLLQIGGVYLLPHSRSSAALA